MMFEHNPFGLAILWTCLRVYKASESILDDFCSFWSIYPPNKQKIAQNSTFWSTKTLFCVIYKTCSLWYVKLIFWAQNLSKLSQKPFWDFENYSKMFSECFWNIKEKTIFWWKKIFQNFFDPKKFEFYNTLPISWDVVIPGNFKRP